MDNTLSFFSGWFCGLKNNECVFCALAYPFCGWSFLNKNFFRRFTFTRTNRISLSDVGNESRSPREQNCLPWKDRCYSRLVSTPSGVVLSSEEQNYKYGIC